MSIQMKEIVLLD